MNDTYMTQLADALVTQKGAEPSTSHILAMLVVDGAAGGSIPDAIEAARTGYPNLFRPVQATAAAHVSGAGDAWAHAPVTAKVLREAGKL